MFHYTFSLLFFVCLQICLVMIHGSVFAATEEHQYDIHPDLTGIIEHHARPAADESHGQTDKLILVFPSDEIGHIYTGHPEQHMHHPGRECTESIECSPYLGHDIAERWMYIRRFEQERHHRLLGSLDAECRIEPHVMLLYMHHA